MIGDGSIARSYCAVRARTARSSGGSFARPGQGVVRQLTHARALLTSAPEGATAYADADVRDTAHVLEEARKTLDLSQPVVVMLIAVLHHLPDSDDPYGIVARLMDAVPPGSYLVISHPAPDIDTEAVAEVARRYNARVPAGQRRRSRDEFTCGYWSLSLTGRTPGGPRSMPYGLRAGGVCGRPADAPQGGWFLTLAVPESPAGPMEDQRHDRG